MVKGSLQRAILAVTRQLAYRVQLGSYCLGVERPHLLDFCREAGWIVEGNYVQRTIIGKPRAEFYCSCTGPALSTHRISVPAYGSCRAHPWPL